MYTDGIVNVAKSRFVLSIGNSGYAIARIVKLNISGNRGLGISLNTKLVAGIITIGEK